MWCANCQSDVAAEVTAENRRVRCATCGSTLNSAQAMRSGARTQEARELLERWANHQLFDPFGPVPAAKTAAEYASAPLAQATSESGAAPSAPAAAAPVASTTPRKPKFRVDQPHPEFDQQKRDSIAPAAASAEPPSAPTAAIRSSSRDDDDSQGDVAIPHPAPHSRPPRGGAPRIESPGAGERRNVVTSRNRIERTPATTPAASLATHSPLRNLTQTQLRLDQRQASSVPRPHFDVQFAIPPDDEADRANWGALIGQLLAYAGVAGLTVGTTLVLWGYFGGPESYTPTGWLITTAGQMLLFLGVITLISGGMEQTTEEVARRIDTLGDKILRIEQSSRDQVLRGPKTPVERFAAGEAVAPPDSTLRDELTELSRQLARYRSNSL